MVGRGTNISGAITQSGGFVSAANTVLGSDNTGSYGVYNLSGTAVLKTGYLSIGRSYASDSVR